MTGPTIYRTTISRAAAGTVDPVARRLFVLSVGTFFIGGFLTAIVSLLVPRFRLLHHLDYTQALLVQFASHLSYLVFAVPIALIVVRAGYMRAIAAGLAIMAVGCVAIAAADASGGFAVMLAALLLLALGLTFLQIAANTVIAVVGASHGSAARLTLLQGFNSLGTVLGPLVTAPLFLAGVGAASPPSIGLPFAASAVALLGLAAAFMVHRHLLAPPPAAPPLLGRLPVLLRDRRMLAGMGAIFAYVGAEVTIGALLTNYLMQPATLGLGPVAAGRFVSLYWAGAMIGRFAGPECCDGSGRRGCWPRRRWARPP